MAQGAPATFSASMKRANDLTALFKSRIKAIRCAMWGSDDISARHNCTDWPTDDKERVLMKVKEGEDWLIEMTFGEGARFGGATADEIEDKMEETQAAYLDCLKVHKPEAFRGRSSDNPTGSSSAAAEPSSSTGEPGAKRSPPAKRRC